MTIGWEFLATLTEIGASARRQTWRWCTSRDLLALDAATDGDGQDHKVQSSSGHPVQPRALSICPNSLLCAIISFPADRNLVLSTQV